MNTIATFARTIGAGTAGAAAAASIRNANSAGSVEAMTRVVGLVDETLEGVRLLRSVNFTGARAGTAGDVLYHAGNSLGTMRSQSMDLLTDAMQGRWIDSSRFHDVATGLSRISEALKGTRVLIYGR